MGADAFFRSIALSQPGRAWQAVATGLLCAAGGLVLRVVLSPIYGGATGLTLFIPAVLLAALWAGQIAGYTATLASIAGALVVASLFPGLIELNLTTSLIGTISFILVALFGTVLAASLRTTLRNLDETVVRLRETDTRVDEATSELQAMVDQASAGIARVDLKGAVVSANARFAEILGLDPNHVVGLTTADVTHPDDIAPTHEQLDITRAGGEGMIEKRYIRPDGSIVWAQTSLRPLRAAKGEVLGHIAVVVDITAAKLAEGAIRESEERFRTIADTAPVLIWVTAQDRTRAFVNQAYVAYAGDDYETARLKDWREIVHPDDHERIISESLTGEATGEPFSMEARYLRHDGEYRWLKSFSRPRLSADKTVVGFVGVAFDVTDIRETQARLLESETRFRTIADSAPAQVWMTDAEGVTVFANKRYKAFFGAETDLELDANWQQWVAAQNLQDFYAGFLGAVERHDRFEGLLEVEHPKLGHRWLRCEGVPRFDGAGQFQGYVGANIDVTEAKRAEDDLKRINELLEERVGEALAEKAKAEADLMHAQRMEAVGRLTGGVAHDFNNLLTVVIGALDMMLKAPDDAARQKKLGEAALAAARRGEGLTHQLLAFSRRQALRPEPVDLNALIRQSDPLLRRAVGEAVTFKLKLRRGGARVHVDPSQFEAALLNLVVNARDAVGDAGSITVQTASCTTTLGEVRELPAGDYVCVTVSDDGAGMDPDIIGRVFEPFFTTKAVGKGTGLGLSQVYGFARQSGGGVGIVSAPGQGTEIRLYLPPLDMPSQANAEPTAKPARSGVEGRRLLLVEDDEGVAAIAVEVLRGLGLEVRLADTAPHALEILKTERFDLMLSDVVMPGGMTGIELARVCSQQYPHMRIVLTSGYAGEDVDAALSNAPWPFVRKPYSSQQLAEVLGGLAVAEPA